MINKESLMYHSYGRKNIDLLVIVLWLSAFIIGLNHLIYISTVPAHDYQITDKNILFFLPKLPLIHLFILLLLYKKYTLSI